MFTKKRRLSNVAVDQICCSVKRVFIISLIETCGDQDFQEMLEIKRCF